MEGRGAEGTMILLLEKKFSHNGHDLFKFEMDNLNEEIMF